MAMKQCTKSRQSPVLAATPLNQAAWLVNTVRSDAEERVAEERLAWKDKNVPAWT